MYLASPSYIRWGLGIVAVAVLIYIVAAMRSVANGPVGQQIGNLLGTAGSLLAALASLPPWLLVGLGFAYLLGPAILKMSGAVARRFGTSVKEGNSKAEAFKAEGRSQEFVDAYAKGLASEVVNLVRQELAAAAGSSQAAQERAAEASAARENIAQEAQSEGGDVAAGDGEGVDDARILYSEID